MDTFKFTRGDGAHHTFAMLASSWTAGATLFFAAKQTIDDDGTDANALIQGHWDDSAITDVVINGLNYKKYACYFPAAATHDILSAGASTMDLLGEFQWVPLVGDPVTFPADENKIPVILSFDVKIKTTV